MITLIHAKPQVFNVAMASANTEYSKQLPEGCKMFSLKLRDPGYPIQVCMVEGESDTTYFTVPQGAIHYQKELKASQITLYFRSTTSDMVAEIVTFN